MSLPPPSQISHNSIYEARFQSMKEFTRIVIYLRTCPGMKTGPDLVSMIWPGLEIRIYILYLVQIGVTLALKC